MHVYLPVPLIVTLALACDDDTDLDRVDAGSRLSDAGQHDASIDASLPPRGDASVTHDAGDAGGPSDASVATWCPPMPEPLDSYCALRDCPPDLETALSQESLEDAGTYGCFTAESGCGVESVTQTILGLRGTRWFFDPDTGELIGVYVLNDVGVSSECIDYWSTAGRGRGACETLTTRLLTHTSYCERDDLDGGI